MASSTSLAFMSRAYPTGVTTDPTLLKARELMRHVHVPTNRIDIFDRERFAWAKALFSEELKNDPTPGFGISNVERHCANSLEGYWVDKHLSSCISTPFMEEIMRRFREAVAKQFGPNPRYTTFQRDGFFLRIADEWNGHDDPYVRDFREVNVESSFMCRIVERLKSEVQKQLVQELPFPNIEPWFVKKFQESMHDGSNYLSVILGKGLKPESEIAYNRYCENFFNERDRRVMAILERTWAQDKAARQENPRAPLTHLVTLESYEQKISSQRQTLYRRIAIAVASSVFFLLLVLLYAKKNEVFKGVGFFLPFSKY